MRKIIYLLPCLILLQSCMPTSGSSDGVKVYFGPLSTSALSYKKAIAHCKEYNKKPFLIESSYMPVYDRYECR